MRILWHSNAPWIRTGYGTQTALWVPRLAALGHEIVISGPFSFAGSPMEWGGFPVLPGAQDPFGSDVIASHYKRNGADLMITLCDVFMMEPAAMQGLNVVHWLPVDCAPMGAQDKGKASSSMAQIAMSRFGQVQMEMAGFSPLYVPHGVDTTVFAPASDRRKLREDLGFDPDTFLVGLNAANKAGPRKAFQEQLSAFAEFSRHHPEARLLIHSFAQPKDGFNIKTLCDALGISKVIMMPDQYAYSCGLMDSAVMAKWYGILDVLMNCTYGEGFGIPVIEAQACGVPVIVTDASAMTELRGSGWTVPGEPYWVPGHDAWWTRPSISEITKALESAWDVMSADDDGSQGMRAQARDFAMAYDADHVLEEYWAPVLDALDEMRPKTRITAVNDRVKLAPFVPREDVRDLLLVVPTRGRPENARRLIQAVRGTASLRTDIIFGIDDDDPSLPDYEAVLAKAAVGYGDPDSQKASFVTGQRKSLASWTNELALRHAGEYAAVASFGDDHCPQTPGWDEELLKVLQANGPGFAYPNDLVRDDIPQAVVVSSEIVKALGWMCLPDLDHYFVDNVWSDLGQGAACIWHLPDVIVEHMHHLRHPGSVKRDQTYRDAERRFGDDQSSYWTWRNLKMRDDVAVISELRRKP